MWTITHTPTADAWRAQPTETEQLEVLLAAFGGANVTARLLAPDGVTLRRVLTLPPLTIDTLADPRRIVLGAHLADSALSTGTLGRWVLQAPGAVDIMQAPAGVSGAAINHAGGTIKTLCTPTLSGVTIRADEVLPTGGPFTVGNVLLTLAGQSNADGRGKISDLSAAPLSSDPGLATFGAAAFARVYIWRSGSWQQLLLGINNGGVNPAPGSGTEFGPEFGLAVRWMRETTSGNLYIVKNGASGASITSFTPDAGFNNYQILESAHTAAQAALISASVTVAQKCFVWVQGETDRLETQSWYQTRMQAVLDAAYLDNWFEATDKQILFQMGTTSTLYGAGVAAAKAAIAATDPTNIKAPPSPNYYDSSGYHQNARGQVQMGYDAFALIFGRSTITV